MDPSKLGGVLNWPQPTKVKEVQVFLGFTNFYRRFIKDFSKIVKPLTTLTKKSEAWHWDEAQEEAFQKLKTAFTTAPVLRIPDKVQKFQVEANASDFATGAVLSQYSPESQKWHPCAFYSAAMTAPERNYEIYDKEMLAII